MKRNWNKRLLSFCCSLMMVSALNAGISVAAENEGAETTAVDVEALAEEDLADDADAAAVDSADEDDVITDENTFIVGQVGYRRLESGGAAVSYVDKTATEVKIPAEAEGEKIVRIDEGAFSQCAALTSVTIPDTVTEIAAGAFYYCLALETLEIPDSVTDIGMYAFANCYALKSIKLPEHLKIIPEAAADRPAFRTLANSLFWDC